MERGGLLGSLTDPAYLTHFGQQETLSHKQGGWYLKNENRKLTSGSHTHWNAYAHIHTLIH